mmetsp:Transcript_3798/g.12067  ORF Transcript_3798/g.12067 Transcript_3798/m.12067 type:complete len:206 (+) Transcript_3798:41-658(+)
MAAGLKARWRGRGDELRRHDELPHAWRQLPLVYQLICDEVPHAFGQPHERRALLLNDEVAAEPLHVGRAINADAAPLAAAVRIDALGPPGRTPPNCRHRPHLQRPPNGNEPFHHARHRGRVRRSPPQPPDASSVEGCDPGEGLSLQLPQRDTSQEAGDADEDGPRGECRVHAILDGPPVVSSTEPPHCCRPEFLGVEFVENELHH